jgi:hypothetical protein
VALGLPLIVVLSGCIGDFPTVDEACNDHVPGEHNASDGADEALLRVNCFRRVATVPGVHIRRSVQESSAAHLDWMVANGVLSEQETPGTPGFTGADVFERLADARWGGDNLDHGIWTVTWADVEGGIDDPTTLADAWIDDPYYRQVLMQPSADGAGFAWHTAVDGEVLPWNSAYMTLTYHWPPSSHEERPIVYPSDGQVDVPPAWAFPASYSQLPDDGIPDGVPIGYPITVTVGGETAVSWAAADPFGFVLSVVSLEGPAGAVPVTVIQPSSPNSAFLQYTAIVIPSSPLDADADYAFTATATWADGAKDIETTFHTLAE